MLIIEEPGAQDARKKKQALLIILGILAALLLLVGVGTIIADRITNGEVLGWFEKSEEDQYAEIIAKILAGKDGEGSGDGSEGGSGGATTITGKEADPNAPSLDEVVSAIGETYTTNLYVDSDAAIVFSNYVFKEAYDGHVTFGTAYKYFEDMIAKVDEENKFNYYYYYARTYYRLDRDVDGMVKIFEQAEPTNKADIGEYYNTMASLCDFAKDPVLADYYRGQLAQLDDEEESEVPEEDVIPVLDGAGL